MAEAYLVHHGIRGMHWGIRRFQNKDGTRTSAGKKRRAETENVRVMTTEEMEAHKNRAVKSGRASEVRKYAERMSQKELAEAMYRIDQYKKLDESIKASNSKIAKAKKIANSIADDLNTANKLYTSVSGTYKIVNDIYKSASAAKAQKKA